MSTTNTPPVSTTVRNGALIGMAAGVAMAMYAMIASATYQHHGFFTPLFHISRARRLPQVDDAVHDRRLARRHVLVHP
jgi:hypothetical protein